MGIRLHFSIDNPITPDDLLTLILEEPKMKLPQDNPRERRKTSGDQLPLVETHVMLPNLDFWITIFEEDKIGREIDQETLGIAPRVGMIIRYRAEVSDDGFVELFAYLLRTLKGDAFVSFDGASPILLRKDGVIMLDEGTSYYDAPAMRELLPPPVIKGKIPW